MAIKRPKESDIQRAILGWLRLNGAVAVRVNSGGFAGTHNGKKRFVRMNDTAGCADILACVGGVFVAIEVKRVGSRTDPLRAAKQEAFLASVRRAQGVGVIATSVDDVATALRRHGICTSGTTDQILQQRQHGE